MGTKQYLGQIERLDMMIQNKLSEIYQLKTMACSVTVSNSEDRIQKTSDKDKLGSTVAKIVDLEKETDELVEQIINKVLKEISVLEEKTK